ncbi:hypothetical protein [Legionella maioricensis]|uniref:Uncharacterized protein n=1 Tax=Legionella maioricensis TaxID=2896528 RepID=A0A9X2CY02_9GAMM|nr:hypothetical protein [Legionella maioricensis]MCL9682593.1 hypothetical protein [Legionella maioricensis]MCL9686160.1 hypothetical protein [Legionella maioricensis]
MKSGNDSSILSESNIPQALVIGCSHDNPHCSHNRETHPNSDDFYTIDINKDLNPDLHLDVVNDDIPENLVNNFKLTILEYLPSDVYNHNDLITQVTGSSGQRGLHNIRNMTDENGLIMVIGNRRSFQFRSSLANLNYIELAESEDKDSAVIIIPNNQSLSFEEVMEQVHELPSPLKNSITAATSTFFQPLEPHEFCKLNYTPSPENKEIITALNNYVTMRMFGKEYENTVSFLGFKFNFGYSRNEKMDAANALINVLLGNQPLESLELHKDALSNGRLKQLIKHHLHGNSIQNLICPKQKDENLVNMQITNRMDSPWDSKAEENIRNPVDQGIDTFISYEELAILASHGEHFFVPPTDYTTDVCLSCGDGCFYKGSLTDIHRQLKNALEEDPENLNLSNGLAIISRELINNPHLAYSGKKETGVDNTVEQEHKSKIQFN